VHRALAAKLSVPEPSLAWSILHSISPLLQKQKEMRMIITTALLALFASPVAQAFQATPSFLRSSSSSSALYSTETAAEIAANKALKGAGGVAGELGLPCEDECALVSYPKLPPSVHPGVVSGQALKDLLNDARERGTLFQLISYL
jgi:hypothetical protein